MKKFLVIRFSALGDIAMTVPVVYDLATQYPDLEISVLSREMARPLFERMPNNVRFIAADLKGRHKGLVGLCRLWRDANLGDFDYIADFHVHEIALTDHAIDNLEIGNDASEGVKHGVKDESLQRSLLIAFGMGYALYDGIKDLLYALTRLA